MKAIIYARLSPRRVRKNGKGEIIEPESIELQIEKCRAYCAFHSYDVVEVFREPEASGGDRWKRPELKKALELCCKTKGMLVVYALSRMARNTRDALNIAAELSDHGAGLAMLDMQISTATPFGRYMFSSWAAAMQLERELTGERTSTAMLHKMKNGKRMGAHCPYGWEVDPDAERIEGEPATMRECPEEQAQIAIILRAKAEGMPAHKIAEHLNGFGHRARSGRWHHEQVRRILKANQVG